MLATSGKRGGVSESSFISRSIREKNISVEKRSRACQRPFFCSAKFGKSQNCKYKHLDSHFLPQFSLLLPSFFSSFPVVIAAIFFKKKSCNTYLGKKGGRKNREQSAQYQKRGAVRTATTTSTTPSVRPRSWGPGERKGEGEVEI